MQGVLESRTLQKKTSLMSKTWISSPPIDASISVVFQDLIKYKLLKSASLTSLCLSLCVMKSVEMCVFYN